MVPGFLFLCLIYWNGKSSIFQMVCNTKIVCILKPWRQGVLSSVYYVFYWRVPSENKVTRNKKEGRHWLWVFRGKLSNAILSFKIKESVFRKCIRLHTYLIAQLFIHLIWFCKCTRKHNYFSSPAHRGVRVMVIFVNCELQHWWVATKEKEIV